MGAGSGVGLRFLQWFLRGIEFCCAALVLAVYSYLLAELHTHGLDTPTWVRAVEGISGVATLYTIIGLLLLCCLAGLAFTSFIAIVLDIAFIGGFIYIAASNRGGAGSCNGFVDTPFGSGNADDSVPGTNALSFRTACRLESACFAVSIVAIIFFALSALTEFALARHHQREKRYGPSPANNYTSGYGTRRSRAGRGGLFGMLSRRRRTGTWGTDANALPEHTHPDAVRASYAGTDTTAVAPGAATDGVPSHPLGAHGSKFGETGLHDDAGHAPPGHTHQTTGLMPDAETAHYPAGNYRYDEGVYNSRV